MRSTAHLLRRAVVCALLASCVSALVDRVVHRAEIVKIAGESYRKKEAAERAEQKAKERADKSRKRRPS